MIILDTIDRRVGDAVCCGGNRGMCGKVMWYHGCVDGEVGEVEMREVRYFLKSWSRPVSDDGSKVGGEGKEM